MASCPEELLLFFHHVPWHHALRDNVTLVERLVTTHQQGVEEAGGYVDTWMGLQGKVCVCVHVCVQKYICT